MGRVYQSGLERDVGIATIIDLQRDLLTQISGMRLDRGGIVRGTRDFGFIFAITEVVHI